MVVFEMNTGKEIEIEIYPHVAPITAKNFLYLCSIGFYDNTTFHRVINEFIVQGGSPNGDPMGGPGYAIKGEFKFNGISNNLKHLRGYISMARVEDDYDSAGSQFFIILDRKNTAHLDFRYAVFGLVVRGMDVVDEIGAVATNEEDCPIEPQTIVRVTLSEAELENAVKPDPIR